MRWQGLDEAPMIGHAGQERTIGTLSARARVGRTGHTLRRVSSVRRPASIPPVIWKKSPNYCCAPAVGNKLPVLTQPLVGKFNSDAARGTPGRQIHALATKPRINAIAGHVIDKVEPRRGARFIPHPIRELGAFTS